MNISPKLITKLEPDEIFVFESNLAGRHGGGAARTAARFGAKRGVGVGMCGQTYAIATKDFKLRVMPLASISPQVYAFMKHASLTPDKKFLVTPIGCGLAGYHPKDIAPMFFDCGVPDNVYLPACFWRYKP